MTDSNIGTLISEAVVARMTPEFVEKAVIERVYKLIDEAVASALRGYSDTAKLIEKAVHDALRVDQLDLPSYGHVVAAMLKAQIEAKVSDLIAGQLAEDMDELLSLAPKTITLSEIAKGMIERRDNDGDYGPVITCMVHVNEYDTTMIYLDEDAHYEDERKARTDAKVRIHFHKGAILSVEINGRDIKKTTYLGRSYGIDQMARAWFACGTIIELDEANVVVSVGDY